VLPSLHAGEASLLQHMQQKQVMPHVISCNTAIHACGNGHCWAESLALLKDMQQKQVMPDVIAYNAAIAAYPMPKKRNFADHQGFT